MTSSIILSGHIPVARLQAQRKGLPTNREQPDFGAFQFGDMSVYRQLDLRAQEFHDRVVVCARSQMND